MEHERLDELCDEGQRALQRTEYLRARSLLERAEQIALEAQDFDALSRLYLPLQETRRQIRQRCGEGIVRFDVMAHDMSESLDAKQIVEDFPHGQLLVSAWGSIDLALEVRRLARERELYLEIFLGAAYPVSDMRDARRHVIAIVPLGHVRVPDATPRPVDELVRLLPAHSVVIPDSGLVSGARRGDDETYAETMALWERLHAPHLAEAQSTKDAKQRIEACRRTIRVDEACEIAHQLASESARALVRAGGAPTAR